MSDVTTTAPAVDTINVPAVNAPLPKLAPFDPNKPQDFGNQYLQSLILQNSFDEELQTAQQAGEEVKKFIGFEMAKAIMHAAEANTDINLHAIFEGNKPVEKLNNRLLKHFGVIEVKIVDDERAVVWTSKEMQEAYDYSAIDKDKDEAEYTRRFNNRKRLNLRMSDACKVAIGLMDQGVKGEQLKITMNDTTKQAEAVIENAPAAIRGDEKKNGSTVVFGKRTPNEGATVAPNVAALVKAATTAHKKADPEETGIPGERADKGADRNENKLGMSDEDFGLIVNNLRKAIMAQENKLTVEQIKQLKALVPYIGEQVKASEAAAKDAAKQADKEKAE